jgi:hypothetical protein
MVFMVCMVFMVFMVLMESAARAAARHYRRLRHREQAGIREHSRPPRIPRPHRDRPHLPLRAHGPRELALPAGLLVVAALVIMAVAGVFGGGTSTPATGTQASTAPVTAVADAPQSATAMSLAAAVRATHRSSTSTTTAP